MKAFDTNYPIYPWCIAGLWMPKHMRVCSERVLRLSSWISCCTPTWASVASQLQLGWHKTDQQQCLVTAMLTLLPGGDCHARYTCFNPILGSKIKQYWNLKMIKMRCADFANQHMHLNCICHWTFKASQYTITSLVLYAIPDEFYLKSKNLSQGLPSLSRSK